VHATAAGHGRAAPAPAPDADDTGSARLAQILAESGVTPGGRRHRYREDGESDDVLARVLGRS